MHNNLLCVFAPTQREEMAKLEAYRLRDLVRSIATTRPDELGCLKCFELLDCFVEMALARKSTREAMSLVQDHLERCGDCREEFEALLAVLQILTSS